MGSAMGVVVTLHLSCDQSPHGRSKRAGWHGALSIHSRATLPVTRSSALLLADPTAMLLSLVPPLYMHVMHPLLDAFAAGRQEAAADANSAEAAAA